MTSKEDQPPPPSVSVLVRLDKPHKLAEQWANGMSGNFGEESIVDFEARPALLGLGGKVAVNSKPYHTNDPVGRKLHAKLDPKKRKATSAEESISPPHVSSSPSVHASGDDDDDDNTESRTYAFSKKRALPLCMTLQTKKKMDKQ